MKALLVLLLLAPACLWAQSPEEKLVELGIELPEMSVPVANYAKYVQTGNLIFLAGHGHCGPATEVDRGKLGRDLTVEQGYEAARNVGVCMLATLKHAVGDLSRVTQIVKVEGMVNSTGDFKQQPAVVNGFSDLMVEVFGEKGKHARQAVGMASLPSGITLEVSMVVEVAEK
ncbi:MAG: RidA family protein [Bacteroidota bacterium]